MDRRPDGQGGEARNRRLYGVRRTSASSPNCLMLHSARTAGLGSRPFEEASASAVGIMDRLIAEAAI